MLPRPGPIHVRVLRPLAVPGTDAGAGEHEATALRDRARAMIVAACGEPDAT
jgi:hypothetical protein